MIVAGIDPGRWGAVAIVETAERRVLTAWPLPVVTDQLGPLIDSVAAVDRIVGDGAELVAVELQAARDSASERAGPRQAWTAGALFAGLREQLLRRGLRVVYVWPGQWKARLDLLGVHKTFALEAARIVFGSSIAEYLEPKRGVRRAQHCLAIAEAALLTLAIGAEEAP